MMDKCSFLVHKYMCLITGELVNINICLISGVDEEAL